MSAHLILTVDYEVFGNGHGCVNACVVDPTERLLRLAERHGAPVTIFVEAAEFMAMEQLQGVATVRRVREQLSVAVVAGHDVQLHLHPQWDGASRGPDGVWALRLGDWRIGDLPLERVQQLIARSKGWLDSAAFGNTPGRECLAFRAGNWCIQPSASTVRALRANRFRVESTVVPGVRRSGDAWSDFRSAPPLPYWQVDTDVCIAGTSDLWEVPIASAPVSRARQILDELDARRTGNSRFAPGCVPARATNGGLVQRVTGRLRRLAELGTARLDISSSTASTMIAITRDWLRRFDGQGCAIPIVAIGHSKNWTARSEAHCEEFLAWARGAGISFGTYGDWLARVEPESVTAPVLAARETASRFV